MSDDTSDLIRVAAAAIIPPFVGAGFVYLVAAVVQDYGWTLFVAAPVIIGLVSTVIYAPRGGKPFWKCFLVSLYYILFISLLVLVLAIEGFVCVAMSLPLAIPLMLVGVMIAYLITNHFGKPNVGCASSLLMILTIPFILGFETSSNSEPTMHQVVSTVEINAPIEKVWKNVIEFPQIDKEPAGILTLGFAFPIDARIEGTGVGAMRYCNFNTGPFVEPITVWDAPHMLAFDVKEQPAPMTELTPYKHLQAAHLEYIRSQKGQFRLYEKDGKTIVEGTTFYTHDIAPDFYWNLFSDEIIHQIHLRVLNHIKEVSEQ
jgi:hypothetical protein